VNQHLYRGVNLAQHRRDSGRLVPKLPGVPFEHVFRADGTILADGSATYGQSAQNAVLAHQLDLRDRPDLHTSGISTTPHLARALYYATRVRDGDAWRLTSGVIYVMDRTRLAALGIREFVVAETVFRLSVAVSDDEEVILVAADCGELPAIAVVERVQVPAL